MSLSSTRIEIPQTALEDLASFVGLSTEECQTRIASIDRTVNKRAWLDFDARTDDDVVRYFAGEERLLWAHFRWHYSDSRHIYEETFKMVARCFPANSGYSQVLDFGCGIGTDAQFFATRGYTCTLADIDGPMFRFARHRFARRGIEAEFVESSTTLPSFAHQFDIILCLDVFEHLADPVGGLKHLVRYLRPGGVMVQYGNFAELTDVHPVALANGAAKFQKGNWLNYVRGSGMQPVGGLAYQKVKGVRKVFLKARFAFWRATGLWITRDRISAHPESDH